LIAAVSCGKINVEFDSKMPRYPATISLIAFLVYGYTLSWGLSEWKE
jgi:hypothetical protein